MRDFAAAGVTTLAATVFALDRDTGLTQLRGVAEAYAKAGVAAITGERAA
jgi:hypothetical protein